MRCCFESVKRQNRTKRRRRSLKINCAKKGDVKEDEEDEESYKMIKHTKIHLKMMSKRKMNKQKESITKQTKKFFFSSRLFSRASHVIFFAMNASCACRALVA